MDPCLLPPWDPYHGSVGLKEGKIPFLGSLVIIGDFLQWNPTPHSMNHLIVPSQNPYIETLNLMEVTIPILGSLFIREFCLRKPLQVEALLVLWGLFDTSVCWHLYSFKYSLNVPNHILLYKKELIIIHNVIREDTKQPVIKWSSKLN